MCGLVYLAELYWATGSASDEQLSQADHNHERELQDLADKIAQLNSAIDDVSAQLKAQDNGAPEEAASTVATVAS